MEVVVKANGCPAGPAAKRSEGPGRKNCDLPTVCVRAVPPFAQFTNVTACLSSAERSRVGACANGGMTTHVPSSGIINAFYNVVETTRSPHPAP